MLAVVSRMASCYTEMKRFEDAEELYHEALSIMGKPGSSSDQYQLVLVLFVFVYKPASELFSKHIYVFT